MVDIISKKRDGYALTKQEIDFAVTGYTNETIPDYQMSALAMAIYFKGMTTDECVNLTMAMVESGDRIDLSDIKGIKVDKHSTGGVGDTTTLILAPLVAALDVPVAKMSGRGLGHTGGTIDKLESIAGFQVELTSKTFNQLVNKNKVAVVGQSGNLTPADKKLYALRDVTATVNSLPLIASSIMSKKIASGADAIVLDVKTGGGAFIKDIEGAKELSKAMVGIGSGAGRETIAVISDMSQPLGKAIGNALEVKEAIETLRGNGPADLTELCLTLGSQMVFLAKKAESIESARAQLIAAIDSGLALDKFKTFVAAQGGDLSVIDHPEKLPQASYTFEVKAKQAGFVTTVDADDIGHAASMLGAGRLTKDAKIDLAVGLILEKKVGDAVAVGETLVTMHSNTKSIDEVERKIQQAYHIGDRVVEAPPLIHAVITE